MTSQRQHIPINLEPLSDALRPTLDLLENEERRDYYQRLLASARPQQEKAALGILTTVLDAVNEAGGPRATIELQGGGYVLSIQPQGAEAEPVFDAGEEVERVTLRLPKRLKDAIDRMAEQSGLSTNSWYIRTLSRSLAHQMHRLGFATQPGGAQGEGPWSWRGRGRRRSGRPGPAAGEARD